MNANDKLSSAVWASMDILEQVFDPQIWKLQTLDELLLHARLDDGLENTEGLTIILGEVTDAYQDAKKQIDSLFDRYREQKATS